MITYRQNTRDASGIEHCDQTQVNCSLHLLVLHCGVSMGEGAKGGSHGPQTPYIAPQRILVVHTGMCWKAKSPGP